MPDNNLTVENNNSNNEEVRFFTDEDFLKILNLSLHLKSTKISSRQIYIRITKA